MKNLSLFNVAGKEHRAGACPKTDSPTAKFEDFRLNLSLARNGLGPFLVAACD